MDLSWIESVAQAGIAIVVLAWMLRYFMARESKLQARLEQRSDELLQVMRESATLLERASNAMSENPERTRQLINEAHDALLEKLLFRRQG